MNLLDTIAILISLAALFSYINARFIRLPTTVGLMIIALLLSLGLIALDALGWVALKEEAEIFLRGIDFHEALMQGMLSFLLFAGALHVNLADLRREKWVVGLLASLGVVVSTFLVGLMSWWVLDALGSPLPLIYCLVFGALISPTDPIAVLGILKTVGAPKTLETKITGESLFNDGVGVVVFLVLLGIATGTQTAAPVPIVMLFVQEALGGALFGFVLGWLAFLMLRSIDNYQVEVLITLSVVMGGYALASELHLSGPIAMVVAGLFIGNRGRRLAMSDITREHLDKFWELVDEVLNAALFVLIGLEVLVLVFHHQYFIAALLLIPVVLLARLISVGLPILGLSFFRSFSPGAVPILTWGGLRGGISVALALSLPLGEERNIILTVTYVIVVFSIVVQGLTISRLIRRFAGAPRSGE